MPYRQPSFQNLWRLFVAAIAFLYVVIIVLGIAGFALIQNRAEEAASLAQQTQEVARVNRSLILQTRTLAREGKKAHDAICVYVAQQKVALKASQEFIREHPNSELTPAIKAGLPAHKERLKSLKVADC